MQCAEFRRKFGTDPKRIDPDILEHRATCAACAQYATQMERLDQMVCRALEVPGPGFQAPPWQAARRPSATRWYALAATLLVAIGLAATFWIGERRDALIVEVVKHADRERDVLVATDQRVDPAKVQRALAKVGAQLITALPISIARTCKIRGNVAPHLVMQTRDGAVAILLLTKERMFLPHSFAKLGYEGRIVPMGSNHSIAVIGTSEAAVAEGAELASGAIQWLP